MITKADVERVANLACIELNDKELQEFTLQLGAILEYFDELSDIEAQPPKKEEENVLRPDEVTTSLPQKEALANAPRVDSGYFRGPRIL
ncbi:MAG: Asp-tRNA(Asn)/Glu-tRNA(Gln) amidotransferase subunit GatC [Euryarchaeota archaeon]|nr:Asp-tRNA(Asn)/Glu-tRNA(Gln) amidotransferase subunit GatC [Euryarchaeota archaeon]